MTDVTLITCLEFPELDPDDKLLADALTATGLTVKTAVWSDTEYEWGASSVCVIRSTWDYDKHQTQFLKWLDEASAATKLFNDMALIKWNFDKSYLQTLSAEGIRTIPTRWLKADEQIEIVDIVDSLGMDIVIKPSVGLGGGGVVRVNLQEQRASVAVSNIQHAQKAGSVMIQPFVQSVLDEGEHSLIFFDGVFSHAIRKSPFAKLAYAGYAGEQAIAATHDEIQFGINVLSKLMSIPLYARVDVILFEDRLHLMELELIEPSLYFSYAASAADELAALIAMHVR